MKKSKKRQNYRHIKCYKDILSEKTHLAYKARYNEKQLELRLLELTYHLHPIRLVPSLVTEWAQPLLIELKNRVKEYFFGRRKKSNH